MASPRHTSPPTTPTKPHATPTSPTNPTTRALNPTTPATSNVAITPVNPPSTPRNAITASARRLINPTTTPPNSLHATRLIHLSAVATPQHSPRNCNICGRATQNAQCFGCKMAGAVPGTPTHVRRPEFALKGRVGSMGDSSETNITPMQKLQEARRDLWTKSISGDASRRSAAQRLGDLKIRDTVDHEHGSDYVETETDDDVEMN